MDGVFGLVGVVFAVDLVDVGRLHSRAFQSMAVFLGEGQYILKRGLQHFVHREAGVEDD